MEYLTSSEVELTYPVKWGCDRMLQRSRKGFESSKENQPWVKFEKKFKAINKTENAVQLLQESIEMFCNVDKHGLEDFILNLRQIAQDLQFKYYKARCNAIIIPPEDSLTFCIGHVLGSLPETTRFSYFESEVQALLKILSRVTKEKERDPSRTYVPRKEIEGALFLLKEKYPIFFTGVTKDPMLIPIFNFSITSGSVLSLPHLHCFGVFKPTNADEHPLVSILHSIVHILHYQLTEDLDILPPGFANLHQSLFDDHEILNLDWAETFAELIVASLLYETEFMPLVAYMELSHSDQKEISKYLSWLETIFASSLQDNIQRLILKCEGKLRA